MKIRIKSNNLEYLEEIISNLKLGKRLIFNNIVMVNRSIMIKKINTEELIEWFMKFPLCYYQIPINKDTYFKDDITENQLDNYFEMIFPDKKTKELFKRRFYK